MKKLLIGASALVLVGLVNQAGAAQPWCHTNWVGGACGVVTNQDTTGSAAANPYVALVIKVTPPPPPGGGGDDEPKDE